MKTALAFIAIASLCSWKAADKCRPFAHPGTSPDGRVRVVPATDWTFEWQKQKDGGEFETVHKGTLTRCGHPHLISYVCDSGIFVIFNPNGGHEFENRIVFYKPDGGVIRSVALGDILNEKELGRIGKSENHINGWIALLDGPGYPKAGLSGKQDHFWLETAGGRRIRLACDTGKLLPGEEE